MDEIEQSPLSVIPPQALSLRLVRSTIRMSHGRGWRIDKVNPVHDLIICLTGSGKYDIGPDQFTVSPGQAMIIPAGQRFRGRLEGDERYTGIAQHFSLELFGRVDFLAQMRLRRVVHLGNWATLEPLARHYREIAPASATTLAQHHQFMVFLLQFLEDAFLGWKEDAMRTMPGQDALSLHIMLTAARLSSDPLSDDALETAIGRVPYNEDYFRRAFRDRIGYTPQKFLEFKRMEKAVHILGTGRSVKNTALDVGYSDPYFFSRMFKRYMGASPSSFRLRGAERTSMDHTD